jgi:hypothetical protein
MPPQGGGDFEDLEIGRAVVYMANAGGAKFPVPERPAAAAPAEGASGAAPAASAPAAAAYGCRTGQVIHFAPKKKPAQRRLFCGRSAT